jgi:hypothetical protein
MVKREFARMMNALLWSKLALPDKVSLGDEETAF